jgi:hypothetical protein
MPDALPCHKTGTFVCTHTTVSQELAHQCFAAVSQGIRPVAACWHAGQGEQFAAR